MFENGLTFLGFIFVLFATLLGAYVSTRWLGTRMLGPTQLARDTKLSVVQRLSIGRDMHLVVVQLGDRHLLIGCTNQNISFLTDLTEEESEIYKSDEVKASLSFKSFSNVLKSVENEKDKD